MTARPNNDWHKESSGPKWRDNTFTGRLAPIGRSHQHAASEVEFHKQHSGRSKADILSELRLKVWRFQLELGTR